MGIEYEWTSHLGGAICSHGNESLREVMDSAVQGYEEAVGGTLREGLTLYSLWIQTL